MVTTANCAGGTVGNLPTGLHRKREEPMQRHLPMQQREDVQERALLREEGNPLPQRQGVLLRQVSADPRQSQAMCVMQGAIALPTFSAGTGSPEENLKLVPSEKHEGEPKRLPFLVAAEHDRSGTGTTC